VEKAPVNELIINQELRQKAFDNYETTDDHGMQIYGIAKDQNSKKYYIVKNSWGETGNYKGIWYVTEAFVRYKTISMVVNKNALPEGISRKIGL
jgi:aminopeptidase C